MAETSLHLPQLFIELGCAIVGLAILARIANLLAFSAIPLYLLAGLAFGTGGLAPLSFSENFIHVGAEIGVLLLLFMLGLEYTGRELAGNLRIGFPAGLLDLLLNFPPGFIAGLILGWKPLAAVLLGGVTYVSSSGIIAKVLAELGRLGNRETPSVLTVLVLEDLAMAVYLPLVAALLAGGGVTQILISVAVAMLVVSIALLIALRFGHGISWFVAHESDEIILLTVLGIVLLVAGIAERFQVSAAIGAFLVGIAISGPVAQKSHTLFAPLRDLFAATFFFFFGLGIDPSTLTRALPFCLGMAVVTSATKILTGYWAARKVADRRGRLRAGAALVARGEFSIVIAGLGASIEPKLGPVSAAYVLILAILGPILARAAKEQPVTSAGSSNELGYAHEPGPTADAG